MIQDELQRCFKKGFVSEPVYKEKYIKTQIKFYEGKINTNVHVNKIPKEGFSEKYLFLLRIGKFLFCF